MDVTPMREVERVELEMLQVRIRGLEEKIAGWEKQLSTICHIIGLLNGRLDESREREKELRAKSLGVSGC